VLSFRKGRRNLGQLVRAQVRNRIIVAAFAAALLFAPTVSRAADVLVAPAPPPPARAAVMVADLYDPTRWEVRFGGFAHGVGSVEKGTWDVNGEIVLPQFFGKDPIGWWSWLLPRLHAGVNANSGGRTSVVYAGLLWTFPITERLFTEVFFDGARHNGSLTGDATHNALGCDWQFHVGGSIGYRISSQWSAMFTFDHLSNGSGIGLSTCGRNQGLNNYGVRIGYTF
jgi:lipid A 3-O-deacylase